MQGVHVHGPPQGLIAIESSSLLIKTLWIHTLFPDGSIPSVFKSSGYRPFRLNWSFLRMIYYFKLNLILLSTLMVTCPTSTFRLLLNYKWNEGELSIYKCSTNTFWQLLIYRSFGRLGPPEMTYLFHQVIPWPLIRPFLGATLKLPYSYKGFPLVIVNPEH